MNKLSGGKQPRMCDGFYVDRQGVRHIQKMNDEVGVPRGLLSVILERSNAGVDGIPTNITSKSKEELVAILECQPDFFFSKNRVTTNSGKARLFFVVWSEISCLV